MAWNQPGRKPDKPPGRGAAGRDDDPPGLAAALTWLDDVFGLHPSRLLLLGLLALLLVGLGAGFHQVGVGERAVVLRAGRLQEVQAPGLHWNVPLLDRVRTVGVDRLRDANLTTDVITRDDGLLTLSLVLHYRIADPKAYLLGFADAEAALLRVAEGAIQEAAADASLADLLSGREAGFVPRLQQEIGRRFRSYGAGLELAGLSLASVLPPADLRSAFADVQRAAEEARLKTARVQQEAHQARQAALAEAARLQAEADLDGNRRVAAAQQQAAAFAQALADYRADPAATRERLYADAVADVLRRTRTVILDEQGLAPLGITALERAPLPDRRGNPP